jgi:peptide chain release factor subunit 3
MATLENETHGSSEPTAVDQVTEGVSHLSTEAAGEAAQPSGRVAPKADTDAVQKEQAAVVDQNLLKEVYGKEHVNVIFLGHVDAGKSTLGGSILAATGMVDERTLDKYKREAKDAGRETWYLSWALDLTKEERAQGKTVEVGRGFFETDKRRVRANLD